MTPISPLRRVVLCVWLLTVILAPALSRAASTIGLYSDSNGYLCSFSGNNAGPVTAYVVIKPENGGVRAARFSAPIPACFDASFVNESTPFGVVSIGDSQTGISVASGSCESDPFQVLQITYLANGGTTSCCEFQLAADPFTGTLEATDCAYQATAISSIVSRFNADASCACGATPPLHLPPNAPSNPFPDDQAIFVALDTQLRWQCSDPAGLDVTSDLYFGAIPDPPLVAFNVPSNGSSIYLPGPLNAQTPYFWRVVARNSSGLETSGPIWHFTTGANQAPGVYNGSPSLGATAVSVTPTLVWNAIDPDYDDMTFDVYLGAGPTPPLVASGLTQQSYTPTTPLEYSTLYSWRVTAIDSHQHSATGATWSFTTKAVSEPPTKPTNPSPSFGATNVSTTPALTWTASDPEAQPLTYDVYFGQQDEPNGATIGLYTDVFGGDCSFSGNQTGLTTVYVVLQMRHLQRVKSISFAAPIPSCFDATFVSEAVLPGVTAAGSSQTGISITFPECQPSQVTALTITYMNHGGTTPCCEYPVVPYPGTDHLEAKDCGGADTPIEPVTSHFNANNTCDCIDWLDMPPLVASNISTNSYSPGALQMGERYWWKIVARDPGGLESASPFWDFTTRPNQPPAVPSIPSPAHLATNQSVLSTLSWQCSDPEGDAIKYDVYFGTAIFPPLVATNVTTRSYDPGPLVVGTTYRWMIKARDALGNEITGPRWAFTTGVGNRPPNAPVVVSPANGAINQMLNAVLNWNATDPDNDALNFDVYFGTNASPPLVTSNVTTNSYTPGTLNIQTAYYWKIVARDAQGLTQTGPVWLFTTVTHPAPFNPAPADNAYASEPLTLRWSTTDPGIHPILCDVYFGTTNPPPLVAADVGASLGNTVFSYSPAGALAVGTRYYWRVFPHTSLGGNMGPVWSFVLEQLGDVNRDGAITLDDASCALQVAIGNATCAGSGGSNLADVNCAVGVTPRDALCIHRRATGQTCLFCGEQVVVGEAALVPSVTRTSLWQVGNTLYAVLAVSNVPSLEAFSFWVRHPTNAPLVAALRRDATGGFTALEIRTTSAYSVVGGYSLNAVNATATTEFIELRFQLGGTLLGMISADTFVDDLAGALGVTIASNTGGKGGALPVIFSRFSASPDGDGVRVGWEFQHDDALDSYTIYRTIEGASTTVPVVERVVTSTAGSYLDRTVEPGRSYRYEMMVRTADGDEFRSQAVSVQVPGLELWLGANHPNPFNPQTTIPYTVPPGSAPVRVRLAIYNTAGSLVRVLVDEDQTGGARNVIWRGEDSAGKTVTSGVYFCVLSAGEQRRTQKLVLLK